MLILIFDNPPIASFHFAGSIIIEINICFHDYFICYIPTYICRSHSPGDTSNEDKRREGNLQELAKIHESCKTSKNCCYNYKKYNSPEKCFSYLASAITFISGRFSLLIRH